MKTDLDAGADDDGRRLETVLRKLLPGQSLAQIHRALRRGDVRLNGTKAAPEALVRTGDKLSVWTALLEPSAAVLPAGRGLPENWVVWAGADLIAVNKPSGLLVHAARQGDDALDERVRSWLAPELRSSLSFRPGPLHRVDRETSGLVVFSRTLTGARSFSAALAERRVHKAYLAVVSGRLPEPIASTTPLARDSAARTSAPSETGQSADTAFVPLAHAPGLTLVKVTIGTGRTHQIRAHAAELGHPLAGDSRYGGPSTPAGLAVPWLLHSWTLSCALLPDLVAPLAAPQALWVQKTFKFSL